MRDGCAKDGCRCCEIDCDRWCMIGCVFEMVHVPVVGGTWLVELTAVLVL